MRRVPRNATLEGESNGTAAPFAPLPLAGKRSISLPSAPITTSWVPTSAT